MIGFEDQVRCSALARQAMHGDAPKALALAPCERSSWESLRGMGKASAEEQLVKELAEKDLGFRKRLPQPLPPAAAREPLKDFVEVFCELAEFRLPMDLDDRVARLRRRALAVTLAALVLLRRRRGATALAAVWPGKHSMKTTSRNVYEVKRSKTK